LIRNSLFAKTFVTIVIASTLWIAMLFLSSVPFVNDLAFEIEEKAGRTILDNVYQLVKQGHQDIQSWRTHALEARKRELRNITLIAESYIHALQRDVARGRIRMQDAQQQAIDYLRLFQYGNKDYVWASDYRSVLISHPDPKLFNRDFSQVKDVDGNLIVPPMVKGAREHGEGYHYYSWNRLGGNKVIRKLSYYRNVPEWEWVIGTGVYIDDIDMEVVRRRQEFIENLRDYLRHTPVANTGYIYIFDGGMNMIIHPNPNIENTNVKGLLDPMTGKPIGEELIAAAKKPDNELIYKWDKPTDPGNYVYDKISWVRHFPEFDWYLASSVYTEELERGGKALAYRLLLLSLAGLLVTIGISYLFVRALITPIRKLATTAENISRGDLSEKIDLQRTDELGVLGDAFNVMVDKLKDQIEHLERRVAERTEELSGWVTRLENSNREVASFNTMSEWLLACYSEKEVYTVLRQTAQELFSGQAGEILILNDDSHVLETVERWGMQNEPSATSFQMDDCLALRYGNFYYSASPGQGLDCLHIPDNLQSAYLCAPITASGRIIGILHLEFLNPDRLPSQWTVRNLKRIANTLVKQAALTITNLRLQAQLQQQSIRDPLTGLYNRRYLDESLPREEQRTRRTNSSLGIIMLDLDHFKQINDCYGHAMGDEILQQLGRLLLRHTRREDIACRYGGEEFILLLPDTSLQDAMKRAEFIRKLVADEIAVNRDDVRIGVTTSVGVAACPETSAGIDQALKAADNALYQAKRQGRNRVVMADGAA